MAKKITNTEHDQFVQRIEELRERGYVPMSLPNVLGDAFNPADPSWQGVINAHFGGSDMCGCGNMGGDMAQQVTSCGWEQTVTNPIDGKQYKYIDWGAGNHLPNDIVRWTRVLPYTATSQQHLRDISTGKGPQPMYRLATVAGGQLVVTKVPYALAGEVLRDRLMAAMSEEESGDDTSRDMQQALQQVNGVLPGQYKAKLKSMRTENIERLQKDLDEWERVSKEIAEFEQRTNLQLVMQEIAGEYHLLGLSIPELELSQMGTEQPDNAQWKPKVVAVTHRSVIGKRLGNRDAEDGRIKHIVLSNAWLMDKLPSDYKTEYTSLPLLDAQHPVYDLKTRLNEWKIENKEASFRSRPTRWGLPVIDPSVGSNFYPYKAWWSIFEGDIYPYLATIISDRATRKRNSNSVGRVVYISTEYLDILNRETDTKKRLKQAEELRNAIFEQTTQFLNNKKKNGSTMMSFTFPNQRGEQTKAIEIVEVPYTSKSQTDADKTELADVASIVFFAMGVHPEIIGAIPGSAASKGGTYMREMLLIDQVTSISVAQQQMLVAYRVASAINEWDPAHLIWEIPRETLTTLDRNSSGVSEE